MKGDCAKINYVDEIIFVKNWKNFKNMLTKKNQYVKINFVDELKKLWSLSSAGRASALQAGGHRFEPYSDHHSFINVIGLVVQLVRMPPCHGGGRRFEPVPGRHFFI